MVRLIVALVLAGAIVYADAHTVHAQQAPAAPTNVRLESPTLPTNLLWDDNSNDETGFRIYKTLGVEGTPQAAATTPADTTSTPAPAATEEELCAVSRST